VAEPELLVALRVPRKRTGGAVDLEPERGLAAARDLRDDDRATRTAVEAEEDVGEILARDRGLLPRDIGAAGEGLHLPRRALADGQHGREVREHLDDPPAGDELRRVEPVRADVADGAKLSCALGLEPPVPVGRQGKPVLQEAAVNVPDLPQLAGVYPRTRLPDQRIEAKVEVRAVDEAGALCQLQELGGLGGREGKRLLADHVLAGLERLLRLRVMQVVRSGQMDDVDALVGEHRFVRVVGGDRGGRARPLRCRADDAEDLDPEPPQGVGVHSADEAGTDHCCLDLVERLQPAGARRRASRIRRRTTLSVRRTCFRASVPARFGSPARIASTIGTWNSASSA
jgi:hypothetical protein